MSGRGFILPPDRSLGPVEAWRSAEDWLSAVMAALGTALGESIRREARVKRSTLLAVARLEAAAADRGTGRNSALSAETIARELGIHIRTVGRARRALARLGASVTVAEGRYLRRAERARTGRLRAASTRALTYPHGFRRGGGISRPPSKMSINVSNPPSRRLSRKNVDTKRANRSLPRQRQAAALAASMPWIAPPPSDPGRHRHVGALVAVLERFGVPETASATAILGAVERANRAHGRFVPDPADQLDPLAVFAWQLAPAAADLAAAPPPPPAAVKPCPPHRFDPVSGWCVKCGRVRQ